MLISVGSVIQKFSELGVVRIDGGEAVDEVQGASWLAETAFDEGEVEACGGLAGVGLGEAVEQMNRLGEVSGGCVEDSEIGEGGGVVGIILKRGSVGGAGLLGVAGGLEEVAEASFEFVIGLACLCGAGEQVESFSLALGRPRSASCA